MTRKLPGDFQRETSPETRDEDGKVRRMIVTLTDNPLWQLQGHELLDGDDETHDAPVFPGVGLYSRPPASGASPEAVVVFSGGASNPLAVALRDEATRAAVFGVIGDLQPDETCVFTSKSIVLIKADGTVEIRTLAGTAVPLATKADLDKLNTAIAGATVVAGDGGASFKATLLAGLASSLHGVSGTVPWPVGTTRLKAE